MKVFLSWSEDRSKEMAEFLKGWLKEVIQAVEPWMSTDIEKGVRWSPKISDELEGSKIGIICLTKENLNNNWILFEAGALSKTKDARVCTFLLDIKPTNIEQPLGQFQHTQFEKEDVRKLMVAMNEAVNKADEATLDEKLLDKSFNRCWPELEGTFKKIKDQAPEVKEPSRSTEEMIQEVLELVRGMNIRQRQEQERIPMPYTVGTFIPSTADLLREKLDRNALVYFLSGLPEEEKKAYKEVDFGAALKSMQKEEQKKKKK